MHLEVYLKKCGQNIQFFIWVLPFWLLVMLFCKVVFFTNFDVILLMAVVHATIGSFVIYLVLGNLFGPSEPTKLIDGITAKCLKCCGKNL